MFGQDHDKIGINVFLTSPLVYTRNECRIHESQVIRLGCINCHQMFCDRCDMTKVCYADWEGGNVQTFTDILRCLTLRMAFLTGRSLAPLLAQLFHNNHIYMVIFLKVSEEEEDGYQRFKLKLKHLNGLSDTGHGLAKSVDLSWAKFKLSKDELIDPEDSKSHSLTDFRVSAIFALCAEVKLCLVERRRSP